MSQWDLSGGYLGRMNTMLYTAVQHGREPVRWWIGRLVARELGHQTDTPTVIAIAWGIPVLVDPETPVGFGLVVR